MERKGRSAAEVCTSASAEDWGSPLRRAIGAEPLSEACLPYLCASAHHFFRDGVAGRNEGVTKLAAAAGEEKVAIRLADLRIFDPQIVWPFN
jgi:hypothetical protein